MDCISSKGSPLGQIERKWLQPGSAKPLGFSLRTFSADQAYVVLRKIQNTALTPAQMLPRAQDGVFGVSQIDL